MTQNVKKKVSQNTSSLVVRLKKVSGDMTKDMKIKCNKLLSRKFYSPTISE